MPNGIFPVPNIQTSMSSGPRWSLKTWITVNLKRNRIDAALAEGADPAASPALGMRASELRSRAMRERLAARLAAAVADARTGQPSNVEHPQRGQVRDSADQLTALAARLRSHQPVDVRGVAMVALLLNDKLHRTGRDQLRDAVADAHSAIIPAHDAAGDLEAAA
jgi:hypothetical protein